MSIPYDFTRSIVTGSRETDGQALPVKAEMWLRDGEWRLLVSGPEWLVYDFARHARVSPTRRIWMHNVGGGMGYYSFLLGTQELQPRSKRERFARWLLRIPSYPKVAR